MALSLMRGSGGGSGWRRQGFGWGGAKLAGRNAGAGEENEIPEYDQSKITGLVQEQMAPFYGELRRGLLSSKARRYSTPTAREGSIRAYTRGAFEALPSIQAGATRTARGLYQPEYQRELMEWKRLQDEEAREEDAATRRPRPIGGGGYREAGARLEAYDPFGASARFDERLAAERPAITRYGASPEQRGEIEARGLMELQALTNEGIERAGEEVM